MFCEPQPESLSRALKRALGVALIVRDKSRTYLRNKGNGNDNDKKQIPCGDDNQKNNNDASICPGT
jgi:hypothetical protein